MENPTIEQVMIETGLGRSQINRFIGLGSLTKIGPDHLTRESVDTVKRCYSLPPKRAYPAPDSVYRGYRK